MHSSVDGFSHVGRLVSDHVEAFGLGQSRIGFRLLPQVLLYVVLVLVQNSTSLAVCCIKAGFLSSSAWRPEVIWIFDDFPAKPGYYTGEFNQLCLSR